MMRSRLQAYGALARIELAGFSFVAVMGGFAAAGALPALDVLCLFVANAILVIFGFVHNDIMDEAVDRLAGDEVERPLVQGLVSRREAWILAAVCLVGNPAFLFAVFRSRSAAAVLFLAQVLAGVYNGCSKKFPGADIFYAASAALLCLSGALAVVERGAPLPPLVWIVMAVMFAEHLFFNVVAGGMKDLTLDRRAGVRTLVLALGREEGNRVQVSRVFQCGALALKAVSVGLVFVPFVLLELPGGTVQVFMLAVLATGTFFYTGRLLGHDPADRKGILDLTRKEETLCKALVPVMLISVVGVPWALLVVVFPVLWFLVLNFLLHGALLTNPQSF